MSDPSQTETTGSGEAGHAQAGYSNAGDDRNVRKSALGAGGLAIGALGVVFGDIGTSPLYAFREVIENQDLERRDLKRAVHADRGPHSTTDCSEYAILRMFAVAGPSIMGA